MTIQPVMIPPGTSVTLVEPQYPVNLGHVARLVKNFGVEKLYLVRPKVEMSVAAMYASHASDVLDRAEVLTFGELRKRNELLVATTAVKASRKSNLIRRPIPPERVRHLLLSSASSSLVFGRDSTGLTNDEIGACDITTTIEAGTRYRALNIGHAVAIMLYLSSRRNGLRGRQQTRTSREVFAHRFYELAEVSGLQQHRLRSLLGTTMRIASTSNLTDKEMNMMSGTFERAVSRIRSGQGGDSKA